MKAPRRLLEDPEQSFELREDLRRTAASSAHYDTARGLAVLQTTLGDSAGFGDSIARSAETASSGLGAGAAGTIPVALKWLLLAAVSGGAIGTFSWLSAPSDRPAPAPAAAPAVPAPAVPVPTAATSDEQATPTPQPRSGRPSEAPAPQLEPSPALPAADEGTGRASGSAASPSRREIAQLVRIRSLLERDPAAAHRAIAAAQREFPAGVLREEREGLDAIALFRSGQERRARASAERFVQRYPESPLRPRLERLLAGEDP